EIVDKVWPTATGWFANKKILEMDHPDDSPAPTTSRVQPSRPPSPPRHARPAGLARVHSPALAEPRESVLHLRQRDTDATAERRGAVVCVKSTDVPALVRALDEDGIVTSERDSNLRIAPHAYNTVDDIDAVLAALRRHRGLLATAG